MSTYSKVLRQIELWEHDRQVAAAKAAHEVAAAAAEENGPEAKRPRFSSPPPMHMGFTSGSVDGVVGRLSEPQNLSRAAAFLAEAQVFLTWISQESSQNQGLMAQLTDRLVWDKVTVKDRTTVLVDAPFIGICGAVHMEELMQSIGEADPLGLRERLLLMYERPRFVRSVQLQEACQKFPAGSTMHEFLAGSFWPLHQAHHPHIHPRNFKKDLNYSWLEYTFDEEAATLFWENFDEHAALQESNYRLDQQLAKKAGKGKTRHFRLALPFHNLMQKVAGQTVEGWQMQVTAAAAKASLLFSRYMDSVFECLDLLRNTPTPAMPGAAAGSSLAAQEMSPRRKPKSLQETVITQALAATPSTVLQDVDGKVVLTMVRAVCTSQRLRNSDVNHLKSVIALNLPPAQSNVCNLRAFRFLHLLGLGVASISTNTSGAKCAFFAKLPREHLNQPGVQASIRALQLETDFFTGEATVVQNARKANQKEIAWPDFTQVDVQETMAATVALVSRVQ